MTPHLMVAIARTQIDDRLEEAERYRRAHPAKPGPDDQESYESVTVRRSYPDDEPALRQLAGRDGRRMPSSPLLVAEVSGRLLAARSLGDGASISDPFVPTSHLVELLALRSAHLRNVAAPLPRRRFAALRKLVPRFYS
jgi:hypothetical protein